MPTSVTASHIVALLSLSAATVISAEAHSPSNATVRVLSVVDAIVQRHVDPPTRQQMLLEAAKFVYQLAEETTDAGKLSERASGLSTREQQADFVLELKTELQEKVPNFEDRFISGMLIALPGGGFLLPAEEVRVQGQVAANRYVGIGIALAMRDDQPVIQNVFYHGPGRKAGVKNGDLILEIDGNSTSGKSLKQIVTELRGEEDSVVGLLLKQADELPRNIPITRGRTFIPTLEGIEKVSDEAWSYTLASNPDVAYIKVKQIGPSSVHELKQIEASLRTQELAGLVLDLREGGGILHDVVLLADQFLDKGTIGHVVGANSVTHEALPGCLFKQLPIAVLIAGSSNADRVYLAAALQDNKRATVIGEPNREPAFVREHVDLPTGEKLLLATGRLQRGDGTVLAAFHHPSLAKLAPVRTKKQQERRYNFIMPDYEVHYPRPRQSETHGDPFLAKAVEVLARESEGDST